ncbi:MULTISPECIES: hypothetical protein [unclassified Breznakia]|uniref:hypothetical protein n=1 Tax=unclassified Breznakia TaxID=2623764 RepID=UPI002475C24D|nr:MULTISPECIES: hypothetical protein [unclassified Breznakia]MDH6368152.1 uncharacterized membrane protein YhaH (DUF805 family) [Breznakia sp. PH1-1]MDH6405241.1 uncharacterized membrane protein YhaH (DUF805 family) [Breznakia sp. PF1-11]MDH6412953.1 uncharacterized membrane protein YhaH (DUF805 family) [Breznakia sp. PFB1-11]MDH6415315.1 uncharacterized membrane protein YhaH (DUF805 family) [Breznakia sp. PFB1-14]MDH6416964.1 uncharacterized membrane protein YhaH (DUF805 family) [Breznakia s
MKDNIGRILFAQIVAMCGAFIAVYVFHTFYKDSINVSQFETFCILALFVSSFVMAIFILEYVDRIKGRVFSIILAVCMMFVIFGLFVVSVPMLFVEILLFINFISKLNMNSVLNRDEQKRIDQDRIDKIKAFLLSKRRLYIYKILIVIIDTSVIFGLSNIIENKVVIVIASVILVVLSFCMYVIIVQAKNRNKNAELFDDILTEECDAKAYCVIYRAIERNCKSIDVMFGYMRGLRWGGYVIEFDRMLNAYRVNRKTYEYKIMIYYRNALDNDVNDNLYKELISLYDSYIKRSKNDRAWIYSKKIFMIQHEVIKEKYTEALENIHELHEYEETLPKISLINQKSLESECLFHLGKYEECMNLLDWIIEHGNTLVVVRNAQDRKQRIHEKLAIEV